MSPDESGRTPSASIASDRSDSTDKPNWRDHWLLNWRISPRCCIRLLPGLWLPAIYNRRRSDQCLGGYSLCAIILVETVPWHAPIPAPSEILPPRRVRRRFNPGAEPGDETAN